MTKAFDILKNITDENAFRSQVLARCVINVFHNKKWVTLFNYFSSEKGRDSAETLSKNVHQFEYPLTTNDELAVVDAIVQLYREIKTFDVRQVSLRKIETV
jgi:hypothetical protein